MFLGGDECGGDDNVWVCGCVMCFGTQNIVVPAAWYALPQQLQVTGVLHLVAF